MRDDPNSILMLSASALPPSTVRPGLSLPPPQGSALDQLGDGNRG